MNDSYSLRTGWRAVRFLTSLVTVAIGTVLSGVAGQGTMAFAGEVHIYNDYVKVIEFRLAPGEATTTQAVLNRVIYSLSRFAVRYEREDRQISREHNHDRGDVHELAAGTTRLLNTGESEARFLEFRSLVIPLDPDPPGPSAYELSRETNVSESAPGTANMMFDSSHFRINEYKLDQNEAVLEHLMANHVVLALSELSLRYFDNVGSSQVKHMTEIDVSWSPAGEYSIQNTGQNKAHFVTVEIKPPQRYTDYEP